MIDKKINKANDKADAFKLSKILASAHSDKPVELKIIEIKKNNEINRKLMEERYLTTVEKINLCKLKKEKEIRKVKQQKEKKYQEKKQLQLDNLKKLEATREIKTAQRKEPRFNNNDIFQVFCTYLLDRS